MDSDPAGMLMAIDSTITLGKIFTDVLVLIGLILLNSFFAASEMALISLNETKLKHSAELGNKKAFKLLKLISNPTKFLATIQVGVTLSGFLASAIAAQSFGTLLANALSGLPFSEGFLKLSSTVIITLVLSFLTLVFGELVPKRIAMQKSFAVASFSGGILSFLSKIAKPFVWLLTKSTNLIVKLFGLDPYAGAEDVTEEEILMMVDAGGEKGFIEESEREMINNIFDFDDITAGQIMTHRIDVYAVEDDTKIDAVVKLFLEEGFSRMPVYNDDLDNILGILYAKDLLKFVGTEYDEDIDIKLLMREAFFVPETMRCHMLFNELKAKKLQMAIVVDEYGGTSGLITVEDLLESIVGNMQDEYDDEDEEISKVNETTFTVDGTTHLDEIEDLLGVELPQGDYDTFAGMIIDILGRIPTTDEKATVILKGYSFCVQSVEDRRIGKVLIEKIPENKDSEEIIV